MILAILSPILSLIVGFVARQVLVGITTGVFITVSLLAWVVVLAYAALHFQAPIRLLLDARPNGSALSDDLDRARKDFMTEIGTLVLERARESGKEKQARVDQGKQETAAATPFVIDTSTYRMDDETFSSIEKNVQVIDVIDFLQDTLANARSALDLSAVVLIVWWPVVVALSFLMSQLPQDPTNALGLGFTLVLLYGFVLAFWLGSYQGVRSWHRALNSLHGLPYEKLKAKIRILELR